MLDKLAAATRTLLAPVEAVLERAIPNRSVRSHLIVALTLALTIAVIYWRSLDYAFQFDDIPVFSKEKWLHDLGSATFNFQRRWISYVTFGWIYFLAGVEPHWQRLGNITLHALTAFALYAFFLRLFSTVSPRSETSLPQGEPQAYWLAFFAALIFAVHPVAVYDVVYVMQRSTIMATLFMIVGLSFHVKGLVEDGKAAFFWSAVCYFLAAFSKEHSVMFVGVAGALTLLLCRPSLSLVKKLWMPFATYLLIGIFVTARLKGFLGSSYEYYAAEMVSHIRAPAGAAEMLSNVHEPLSASEALRDGRAPAGTIDIAANTYLLSVITQGYLFFKYLVVWVLPNPDWMSVDMRQSFAKNFLSWPETAGFVAFLIYPIFATRLLLRGGKVGLFGFGMLAPWILFLTELSTVRIQEPFVLYRSYLWMWALMAALPFVVERIPAGWKTAVVLGICIVMVPLAINRTDTFASSLRLWNDVVQKNTDLNLPGVERGLINRGSAYLELGRPQLALEDYSTAIRASPHVADTYVNRGAIYSGLARYHEALVDFNKAVELAPALPSAYVNRGLNYLRTSNVEQALRDLNKAIELDPQHANAYANRGLAYMRTSRLDAAQQDFSTAIQLSPGDVDNYVTRGVIYMRLKQFDKALLDFTQALTINPRLANAYFNRGLTYLNLARLEEAEGDFARAITIRPNYASAYLYRGMISARSSRLDDALQDFNRAIAANPQIDLGYLGRADVHRRQGRLQEATADYDRALVLNPRNADAYFGRGAVFADMNKGGAATADFRASCKLGNQAGCGRLK